MMYVSYIVVRAVPTQLGSDRHPRPLPGDRRDTNGLPFHPEGNPFYGTVRQYDRSDQRSRVRSVVATGRHLDAIRSSRTGTGRGGGVGHAAGRDGCIEELQQRR